MNKNYKSLENQFILPSPKGSKLILAAPSSHRTTGLGSSLPLGVGVNEENQEGVCMIPDTHIL
jgi:hypothetical protein